MYHKKTIVWRFDDLCFDKNSPLYTPPQLVNEVAKIFHQRNQKANFAFIVRPEDIYSKETRKCLHFLKQNGHQILTHGAPHVNWQQLSTKEMNTAVADMKQNLTQLNLTTNIFVFPGLKPNPRAYPCLKKHGFNVLLKGNRRLWLPKITDKYYTRKYRIDFFPEHNWSTQTKNWTLKPIRKFYSFFEKSQNFNHVMDHLWLYNNTPLKEFEEFIAETSTTARYVTIQESLSSNKNKRV